MADSGVSMVDFLSGLRSEGSDVDATEFVILVVLASRSFNPANVLYQWTDKVAQSTLAKESKLSLRKASDALRKLDGRGMILRQTGGKKREVHQYCVTAKSYCNYLIFLRDKLGRPIDKGLALLRSLQPTDDVCRIDLGSEISRSANRAYLNELDKQTVPNQNHLDKQTVLISDKHVVPTERSIRKKEFSGKEESPPTPNGVAADGGGVFSFSFSQLKTIYDYARAHYPILAEKVSAMPDTLPKARNRAISEAISKKRPEAWVSYFKSLVPLLRSFSGDNLTSWERLVLETEGWEQKVKEHRAKVKKGR